MIVIHFLNEKSWADMLPQKTYKFRIEGKNIMLKFDSTIHLG